MTAYWYCLPHAQNKGMRLKAHSRVFAENAPFSYSVVKVQRVGGLLSVPMCKEAEGALAHLHDTIRG